MVKFGGQYIYHNHHDDIEYQRICSKNMDKSIKKFLTKMTMMFIGYTVGLMGPIYAFTFYGIRTTTFEFAVPFTEEKSWTEFGVNNLIQFLTATHGGLFYIGMEIVMEINFG